MSAATPSRFRCQKCGALCVDVRPKDPRASIEQGCALCEPLVLVDVVSQLYRRDEPKR